jgi:hypothetical protein
MGRGVISFPALFRITDILYSLYIVNEPSFISCYHIRNLVHHLCVVILLFFVCIFIQCLFVQYMPIPILLLSFMPRKCMCFQVLVTRINIVLSSFLIPLSSMEFKYRRERSGVDFVMVVRGSVYRRCIGRYGKSAARAYVSWQVTYGTVRRVCEWPVHSRASSRGARRAGTEEVVLAARAGVVQQGSVYSHNAGRLVSRYQLCREDTARELNKSTCATSAGKCWNRIGTSTSVVFTFFYDG